MVGRLSGSQRQDPACEHSLARLQKNALPSLGATKALRRKMHRSVALGMGRRKRTIRHFAGRRARHASSPKSLSKVMRMRSSRTARASTSASGAPGESARTDARSCPATRSAAIASPGKFSLAKNRTTPRSVRRHWIDLFRAQRIAGVA